METNTLQQATPILAVRSRQRWKAEIILGNPKLKCARFGICQIKEVKTFNKDTLCTEGKVNATLWYKTKTVLCCAFDLKTMHNMTYQRHFSTGRFKIESTVSYQSVYTDFSIIADEYPIIENEDKIIVFFTTT